MLKFKMCLNEHFIIKILKYLNGRRFWVVALFDVDFIVGLLNIKSDMADLVTGGLKHLTAINLWS